MNRRDRRIFVIACLCIFLTACGRSNLEESSVPAESAIASAVTGEEQETKTVKVSTAIHIFHTQNVVEGSFVWEQAKVISSVEELAEYRKMVEDVFSWAIDAAELWKFRELADSYCTQWFQEKTLLAIPVKHSNWDYEHEVRVYRGMVDGCMEICVSAERPETETYASEACWFMLIEVERAEMEKTSEVRVSVDEAVDETKVLLSTATRATRGVEGSLKPVVVQSVEQLRDICKEQYKQSQTGTEVWMPEEMKAYSDGWFEENSLALVYVMDYAKGYTYDARALWCEEKQALELDLFQCIHANGVVFEQLYGQLIMIELPKMDVGSELAIESEIIAVTLPELGSASY